MTTLTVIGISEKARQVIDLVKGAIGSTPTGVSFFSVRNYTNKQGETSNYVINVGGSYEKAKQDDIKFLRELDVTKLKNTVNSKKDLMVAKTELIKSFEAPHKAMSEGQKNAYTVIANGVKVHNETGLLYVFGSKISKTIIKEGVYPTEKALKPKDELRKLLKTSKIRQYSLEVGNTLSAKGETIEL